MVDYIGAGARKSLEIGFWCRTREVSDPRLRERLAAEWASASKEKKFGLVFEGHLPELLPLHKSKPGRGDLVCRRAGQLKDVRQVKQVRDGVATCI